MATQNSAGGKSAASTVTDLDSQAPTAQQVAAEPQIDVEEVKGKNFDGELNGTKINLTIMAGQEDGGNDAVNISLNGYMYQIPRNVPCKVPAEVGQIIQNAEVIQYIPGPRGIPTARPAPRFAFTITASA